MLNFSVIEHCIDPTAANVSSHSPRVYNQVTGWLRTNQLADWYIRGLDGSRS